MTSERVCAKLLLLLCLFGELIYETSQIQSAFLRPIWVVQTGQESELIPRFQDLQDALEDITHVDAVGEVQLFHVDFQDGAIVKTELNHI